MIYCPADSQGFEVGTLATENSLRSTPRIDALAQYASTVIVKSLTDNTRSTYKRNYLKFVKFVRSLKADFQVFPANHGLVVLFAAQLSLSGLSPASVTSILSSVAYIHKLYSLPDPTSHFLVVKFLVGLRKG